MSLRIKTNDRVQVITGSSRGIVGRVLGVDPEKFRATVEGANVRKKHMKARGPQQPGAIIDREMPIHMSNLLLFCEACKRGVRFRVGIAADGKKTRVCVSCARKGAETVL